MAYNVRHPLWLSRVPKPGIRVFAMLYGIESFARATTVSIIPIQALSLLGDAQSVSFLYALTAVVGLLSGLAVPLVIRRISRRWTYTLGAVFLIVCAASLGTLTLAGQIGGMFARTFGSAALNITLSLYILDYIRKHEFVRNDSARLAASTFGWMVAPALGVWLYEAHGPNVAFVWSAICAVLLMTLFWYFRLSDKPQIQPARMRPINPLRHIGRFFAQPRMRLAWFVAFGRSSFWTMFFIYAPILMVKGGEDATTGGLVVSVGNATLITVLFWAWVESRLRLRRTLTIGFAGITVLLALAGYFGAGHAWAAAACLVGATLFAACLDAAGGALFFRSVRIHERAEMTAVYRSYLDLGELIPPMIFGVLLGFFGLGAVFVAMAVLEAVCIAVAWRYIHPRL